MPSPIPERQVLLGPVPHPCGQPVVWLRTEASFYGLPLAGPPRWHDYRTGQIHQCKGKA